MLIIPAIDLKNGKCVRLEQGKMEQETIFSQDPPAVARKWEALGAEMLHLVDLDGAFAGSPKNKPVIEKIVHAIRIPIELGGGIRTLESIEEYLKLGINRVILGTVVYQQKNFLSEACAKFPGHIVVGIDARNGKVAIQGWAEQTGLSAIELAKNEDIKVAYSNQSFELWYLLHFHFYNTSISRDQYVEKLKDLLGHEYQKNNAPMYDELLPRQSDALRHASRLFNRYQNHNPAKNDPSTTVYMLVEELNKFL